MTPTIVKWLAQTPRDAGKPLSDKEGLTTAKREELVHLCRECRQIKMECDIQEKATACFAAKNDLGLPNSSRS